MTVASDDAVEAIRQTDGLPQTILKCSSYSLGERSRRWLRLPQEMVNLFWRKRKEDKRNNKNRRRRKRQPFSTATKISNTLDGQVLRTANQVTSAIGNNKWFPKSPGQRGLRICSLDGGGARGMVAVSLVKGLVEEMGGVELADSFDIIAGTSTGGIISFLTGLRRESSTQAAERYNQLIKEIFKKSPLSTPLLVLTTACKFAFPSLSIMHSLLSAISTFDFIIISLICFCFVSKRTTKVTL